MDTTLKTLKASLDSIRDMATNALNQIEQSQEQHCFVDRKFSRRAGSAGTSQTITAKNP